MDKAVQIAESFLKRGIELVGPVIKNHEGNNHIAFVAVSIGRDGKQIPNNYSLSKAEKSIEEKFGGISIVLINSGDHSISLSIKSLIFRKYIDDVRNVFSAINNNLVDVWIEPKKTTGKKKSDEIRENIAGLIAHYDLKLNKFINLSELNLPSETTCVNVIRKMSPVMFSDIVKELEKRHFQIPDDLWLAKILDRWRKNGMIYRKKNGQYIMTVFGLRALGSGKNRRSPDVIRVLDMASHKI